MEGKSDVALGHPGCAEAGAAGWLFIRETGNGTSEFNCLARLKLFSNASLLLYLQSMDSLAVYDIGISFRD